MSHTTTINSVVIRDADALRRAVAELQNKGVQCSLLENAKPRMYYSHQEGVCEFVVRLDNARYNGKNYDIGLKKQADGTYSAVFDEWGNAVAGEIGATCPMPNSPEGRAQWHIGQLLQGYAKFAAMNAAAAQGYMVESATVDAEGNVNLEIAV
jgi:hypothetical protein